jgi:hypothetical protein
MRRAIAALSWRIFRLTLDRNAGDAAIPKCFVDRLCHKTVIYGGPNQRPDFRYNSTSRPKEPANFRSKKSIPSIQEFKPMLRFSVCSAVFMALVSIGTMTALAQTPSSRPKSPGEIAAAGRLLAVKTEICRRQAREQNLGFLKRRRFVRDCVKDWK